MFSRAIGFLSFRQLERCGQGRIDNLKKLRTSAHSMIRLYIRRYSFFIDISLERSRTTLRTFDFEHGWEVYGAAAC